MHCKSLRSACYHFGKFWYTYLMVLQVQMC